jgi:MFS family permease
LQILGEEKKITWLPVAYSLAIAATCPFVGYVQDLIGRREIALGGCFLLCVGIALMGCTKTMSQAITGAAIAGVGCGVAELTALAG